MWTDHSGGVPGAYSANSLGLLQRVLPDWAGSTVPVRALTATRLLPARTRAFIDFMKENAQNPD